MEFLIYSYCTPYAAHYLLFIKRLWVHIPGQLKQLSENQQEKRKDFFGKRPRLAIFKFGGSISKGVCLSCALFIFLFSMRYE